MCLRNHYSMRQGLLNMLPHQKLNTTLKCLNFVLQVVDIFCFNASGCSDSGSKDGRRPPKMVTKSTDPGVLFPVPPAALYFSYFSCSSLFSSSKLKLCLLAIRFGTGKGEKIFCDYVSSQSGTIII